MAVTLIILSILCWLASLASLPRRILIAPALSYCGLFLISFARSGEYPLIPISNSMLYSWLTITLVVMLIIILQNPAVRAQSRGVGYMILGGMAGMAVGLIGFSISSSLQLLYALMIIGAAAGIILGMIIFSNTPDGRGVNPASGNFFRYLLSKGFPILISIVQIGIVAVIAIASYTING